MNTRRILAFAATATLSLASLALHAETVKLKADLKGASEVPAKETAGKGTLTAAYDTTTKQLHYHVVYDGLTGSVSAAHFHGPAAEGVNAKPQVPVKAPFDSPIDGDATLTDEQSADLLAGKWYFNLHTAANPGGEVRGQVVKE
jgi:hypothetical protein